MLRQRARLGGSVAGRWSMAKRDKAAGYTREVVPMAAAWYPDGTPVPPEVLEEHRKKTSKMLADSLRVVEKK